jgi:hypothetical protein
MAAKRSAKKVILLVFMRLNKNLEDEKIVSQQRAQQK